MLSQAGKQKLHDFALVFAAAEYENEIEQRRSESNDAVDSRQKRAMIFHHLYKSTIETFKNRPDLFGD